MQTAVLHGNDRVPIPLGTPLISYNRWTGFETKRFQGQYNYLNGEAVSNLEVGAIVYVEVDPIHPMGKVYGRLKGKITHITVENGMVSVGYECGHAVGGMKRVPLDAASTDFATAIDEEVLAAILDELPLAKVINR